MRISALLVTWRFDCIYIRTRVYKLPYLHILLKKNLLVSESKSGLICIVVQTQASLKNVGRLWSCCIFSNVLIILFNEKRTVGQLIFSTRDVRITFHIPVETWNFLNNNTYIVSCTKFSCTTAYTHRNAIII